MENQEPIESSSLNIINLSKIETPINRSSRVEMRMALRAEEERYINGSRCDATWMGGWKEVGSNEEDEDERRKKTKGEWW
jgi:hypothetical protein